MHPIPPSGLILSFRAAIVCALLSCALPLVSAAHALSVSSALVDYQENPATIDAQNPAFSWKLESPARGTRQTAYRVVVDKAPPAGDAMPVRIWDSGRVESSQAGAIHCKGRPLESNSDYEWSVTVWDNHGNSATKRARFSTALLEQNQWRAKWIGGGGNEAGLLLRRVFSLEKQPVRARVFAAGLGFYELQVNGAKAGDVVLVPGRTNYQKQVLYNVYDVTPMLRPGANAIGIMLGNGWFDMAEKFAGWREKKYGAPRAIVQLHIDYADGTSDVLVSDESWRKRPGPVTQDCIYDGESFDARREPAGWSCSDFLDTDGWTPANVPDAPGGGLRAERVPNRITATLRPVAILNPGAGVHVIDFGQNIAGWVRMKVAGEPGVTVTLRHAENINEDGTLNRKTNGKAAATDRYTLRGGGEETWSPRFTWHGFRYVEVTGWPGEPAADDFTACVINSDCGPAGEFTSGDELINRIHRNTVWSQRGNMQGGVQTDCPQRDERLGWLADAHVTVDEAWCNFDMAAFYIKWLRDMQLMQDGDGAVPYVVPRQNTAHSIDWSAGYLIIAWSFYMHTGDVQILENHYPNFIRYIDYLGAQAKAGILPPSRYGDWCSVAQIDRQKSGWVRGTPELTTTGYYYYCASLMAKIAAALGKTEDARRHEILADKIGTAFHQKYFDAQKGIYLSEEHAFQFAQLFPLHLGLVPGKERRRVFENLITRMADSDDGRIKAGILGTRYFPDVMEREGREDLVWAAVTKRGFPSYESMLAGGRTTLAEHWDGSGSGNHVMFGSIDAWFYKKLAGLEVDPSKPGYERIIVRPHIPANLDHAGASIQTVRGRAAVAWEKTGGNLRLRVEVPANSEALVWMPANAREEVREGGTSADNAPSVTFVRQENGYIVFAVESGVYEFIAASAANRFNINK
ncbi:MAG: glycoside hydrolase family 78 protein [Opitutaceae bacterium]|nr:glycoside hydrolase family 78 protein [Opitutaceae bacterium]